MTVTALPTPALRTDRLAVLDAYGNARLPASAHSGAPERIDKIPYGRFRNVYLYISGVVKGWGDLSPAGHTTA